MASQLKQEWKNNFKSLWKYTQAVNQGMHGFVRDQNGKPIDGAEIKIDDRTKIVHSNKDGAFWRLLLPGNYKVTVSANGFKSVTSNITVTKNTLFKNFTLAKN